MWVIRESGMQETVKTEIDRPGKTYSRPRNQNKPQILMMWLGRRWLVSGVHGRP